MNLNWRACWVTFWEHRNDDVGAETLVLVDLVHDLLGDFGRNCVVAVGVVILKPYL